MKISPSLRQSFYSGRTFSTPSGRVSGSHLRNVRLALFYSVGLLWLGHQGAYAQQTDKNSPPLTAEMPDVVPPRVLPINPLVVPPAPNPAPATNAAPAANSAAGAPPRPARTPAPATSRPTPNTARPRPNTAPAPATVTPPPTAPVAAPVPTASKINVLILAFDEVTPAPFSPSAPLPVPSTTLTGDAIQAAPPAIAPPTNPFPVEAPATLPPLTGPASAVPPVGVPPSVVPAPANSPLPAPASWRTPNGLRPLVRWEALADKKKDKDADLFLPIPEPSNSPLGRRSRQDAAEMAAAAQNPGRSNPSPAPADLFPPSMSLTPAGAAIQTAPPGRSQQAAFALRRALVARGYGEVLTTGPDGVSVIRALGERRLAPHVLEDLKRSIGALSIPGQTDKAALNLAVQSASRVGQALGYQAVIALYVTPPSAGADAALSKSSWNAVLVDSTRERGETLLFDESAAVTGGNETTLLDAGAATGAALLDKSLQNWLPPSNADKVGLAAGHLAAARAALAAGDNIKAQDELNQTISLDPTQGDAYVLLGDALKDSDPTGAAAAYRRAVELNARDGGTWAKIAQAYAYATPPDWPRTLEAGRRALATGYDSVELRVAMATAQYGRANLFRNAERISQAEDAELEAKSHLDRALALAPDDPSAVRLLANTLLAQNRFNEAIQTLDRIAARFPNDPELQKQYAAALTSQPGREEDAFVAYSRVWKQTGQKAVNVDAMTYRSLAQGFDLRLFNLGKVATQLSAGVSTGAVAREAALLQLSKLKEDMNDAEAAINTVQAPLSVGATTAASRVFAADLMNQSLDAHQTYLETGQPIYRSRGLDLYRRAVARLNVARNSG